MAQRTVAQIVARICARHGVKRAFGVPGGGSSLDLIRALAGQDIPFTLTRTEAGAAMAAAASAEASGSIGVAITTQGPGTASAVNGMAHASLDRCPVMLISDGWTPAQQRFDTHQAYDQQALMAPIVKGATRLDGPDPSAELETLLAKALTPPWGPVYVELTGEAARRLVTDSEAPGPPATSCRLDPQAVQAARAMMATAKRPVLLAGLEAREPGEQHLAALAEALGAPVLTTYKAKGALPEDHPHLVGLFTGGAAERPCVGAADLIILCGFDPVELIGRAWPYTAPVLDLGPVRHPVHYVEPALCLHGPVSSVLRSLGTEGLGPARWAPEEIARLRREMLACLAYPVGDEGVSPEAVVRLAYAASAAMDPRAAVDAGAMMFSAMAFWPARRLGDVLISNGLASMAYALPAGIAMSLQTPDRPVFAFTGDGGLMMCAGELSAAAQHARRLVVVVFNDGALSLIAIKQKSRQLPREGVQWPRPDFAAVARGFGVSGFVARSEDEYRTALEQALAVDGPSLIDVHVDASGYLAQSIALRG